MTRTIDGHESESAVGPDPTENPACSVRWVLASGWIMMVGISELHTHFRENGNENGKLELHPANPSPLLLSVAGMIGVGREGDYYPRLPARRCALL